MINNLIKILCLDKFVIFRDIFKMKIISHYLFKIILNRYFKEDV